MAFKLADRVKETTTTTGTGDISLAGAASGFQAFGDVLSDDDTTHYCLVDASGDWEVGLGTYASSGDTLARTTILASSNSGSAIDLPAGTATLFLDASASFLNGLAKSADLATVATTGDYSDLTGLPTLGTLAALNSVDLTANVGSTVLPVANGGTGSASQNFVDLSTTQTIGGTKSFSNELQTTQGIRILSDGSIGVTLDGSNLSKGTWALKQGSDGTFLFDQTGSLNARFKLGGTTSGNTIDFTPDYSNSYFKVTGAKVVSTFNNTLDDGSGGATLSTLTLGTPLAIGQGGTGSATKNFVDLSNTQTVAGNKTFSNLATFTSGLNANAPLTSHAITAAANATYAIGDSTHYYTGLFATTLNLNSTASIGGGTAGKLLITGNLDMQTFSVLNAFIDHPVLTVPKFDTNSTGSTTALLGANSPAVTGTAPYTWLQMKSSDGSTVYVPCWK